MKAYNVGRMSKKERTQLEKGGILKKIKRKSQAKKTVKRANKIKKLESKNKKLVNRRAKKIVKKQTRKTGKNPLNRQSEMDKRNPNQRYSDIKEGVKKKNIIHKLRSKRINKLKKKQGKSAWKRVRKIVGGKARK